MCDLEEMKETKSTGPLNQEDGCTYELTGVVATYTESTCIYNKWGPSSERKTKNLYLMSYFYFIDIFLSFYSTAPLHMQLPLCVCI